MRKIRNTLFVVAALTGLVVGALLIWNNSPPAGPPHVSVTFLGYTNDAAGVPLARVAVSNLNGSVVSRKAILEVRTASGTTGRFLAGYTNLLGGAFEVLTVPAPTNQAEWRIALSVYPDVGIARIAKRMVVSTLWDLGLRPRYQTMPYNIHGAWIQSEECCSPPNQ